MWFMLILLIYKLILKIENNFIGQSCLSKLKENWIAVCSKISKI